MFGDFPFTATVRPRAARAVGIPAMIDHFFARCRLRLTRRKHCEGADHAAMPEEVTTVRGSDRSIEHHNFEEKKSAATASGAARRDPGRNELHVHFVKRNRQPHTSPKYPEQCAGND